jgi:hypothetical protein
VDGVDDLGVVDSLEVDRRDPEVIPGDTTNVYAATRRADFI